MHYQLDSSRLLNVSPRPAYNLRHDDQVVAKLENRRVLTFVAACLRAFKVGIAAWDKVVVGLLTGAKVASSFREK